MEPVGIYHLADPAFAAIDAQACPTCTSGGLDLVAATMLAATVAEAFHPGRHRGQRVRAALNAAPTGKLHTFDRRPFKSCRDYIETCLEVARQAHRRAGGAAELYKRCLLYHMIRPPQALGLRAGHVSRFAQEMCGRRPSAARTSGGIRIHRGARRHAGGHPARRLRNVPRVGRHVQAGNHSKHRSQRRSGWPTWSQTGSWPVLRRRQQGAECSG